MKKLMILILCTALLTACGKKKEILSGELAQKLCAEVPFSEQLTEIDETTSSKLLYLNPNDYSEIMMYVGTQATCDELALIRTNTPDEVIAKLKSYLVQLKANYTLYRPAEADKAENAFITSCKGLVVMVVSGSPETAEQVFRDYLKK